MYASTRPNKLSSLYIRHMRAAYGKIALNKKARYRTPLPRYNAANNESVYTRTSLLATLCLSCAFHLALKG